MKPKIIFFGTSEIAVFSLQALIENNYDITAIITQPDRPQGRKKLLISSPVKKLATKHNLSIIQPSQLKLADIEYFQANLGILVSYGQIIKPDILNYFKHGIINMHASLLPKHRGASPIQKTLLNADKQAGATLMKLVSKVDAGPIIAQINLDVLAEDDNLSLTDKLGKLGAELLIDNLNLYIENKINLQEQNHNKANYSKIIKKSDGEISLDDDAKNIIQKLKAYTPWPGIYFFDNKKRFKIKKAHLNNEQKLVIDIIQPEGKKDMSWDEFERGYKNLLPHLFGGIEA